MRESYEYHFFFDEHNTFSHDSVITTNIWLFFYIFKRGWWIAVCYGLKKELEYSWQEYFEIVLEVWTFSKQNKTHWMNYKGWLLWKQTGIDVIFLNSLFGVFFCVSLTFYCDGSIFVSFSVYNKLPTFVLYLVLTCKYVFPKKTN